MNLIRSTLAIALTLAACSGGGGSSGDPPPSSSLPPGDPRGPVLDALLLATFDGYRMNGERPWPAPSMRVSFRFRSVSADRFDAELRIEEVSTGNLFASSDLTTFEPLSFSAGSFRFAMSGFDSVVQRTVTVRGSVRDGSAEIGIYDLLSSPELVNLLQTERARPSFPGSFRGNLDVSNGQRMVIGYPFSADTANGERILAADVRVDEHDGTRAHGHLDVTALVAGSTEHWITDIDTIVTGASFLVRFRTPLGTELACSMTPSAPAVGAPARSYILTFSESNPLGSAHQPRNAAYGVVQRVTNL